MKLTEEESVNKFLRYQNACYEAKEKKTRAIYWSSECIHGLYIARFWTKKRPSYEGLRENLKKFGLLDHHAFKLTRTSNVDRVVALESVRARVHLIFYSK